MQTLERIVGTLEGWVWATGIPVAGETIPFIVIALLGTGVFLTLRLGFIQVRALGHGFAVTTGKYDDPNEPGDVPHFQALTTALSATVGIGNIAGVALAIHFGGPGALLWMWVTAALGMAVKYTEVTLAQHYRHVSSVEVQAKRWEGTVSGGPMYYIERGLGPRWKPLAVFFAAALMTTAFLTGNGVQANTVADVVAGDFGIPAWITGLVTASIVALVIIGGIQRIGQVTGVLAPLMALIYVLGALVILMLNYDQVLPSFGLIFREAFAPSAGVAGTGAGVFLVTMMWGVRRGLFSNEAGQGSAPIAHAAAKTDEPVSEGVVALLEPFIDTLVICSMTGLVILVTGAVGDRVPTTLNLTSGDLSYVAQERSRRLVESSPPSRIVVENGYPREPVDGGVLSFHQVPVERFFVDAEQTLPLEGMILAREGQAVTREGAVLGQLYGDAVRTGAPLTQMAFQRGLEPIIPWGGYIVLLSVLLFAISTAIAWSYYGDRCAFYLFGPRAVLPYKMVFVGFHFLGAVASLAVIWTMGDIALGLVTFPNLIAIVLLSGVVAKLTRSYFERRPWEDNAEVHRRLVAEKKARGRGLSE